jgi:NADPH:quinone reductase-like Zn-dependent oxidoreductase
VEFVRASGLEIAYERVGDGPPLVFVHGAAEDGRVWQSQIAALSDEFTVVAWDEPGADRSSDVPADFGLTDYDVVLDSRGGENLERSLTVLKPGGQAIGVTGPPDPGFAKQLGAPKFMGVVMGLLSRKVRTQARKLGVSYR